MEKEEILNISQAILQPTCGIYFLIHENEIVYVGQSINVVSRVGAHTNNKLFDRWAFIPCEPFELNKLEVEYLIKFNPKHNKTPWISEGYLSREYLKFYFNIDGYLLNRIIKKYKLIPQSKRYSVAEVGEYLLKEQEK